MQHFGKHICATFLNMNGLHKTYLPCSLSCSSMSPLCASHSRKCLETPGSPTQIPQPPRLSEVTLTKFVPPSNSKLKRTWKRTSKLTTSNTGTTPLKRLRLAWELLMESREAGYLRKWWSTQPVKKMAKMRSNQ